MMQCNNKDNQSTGSIKEIKSDNAQFVGIMNRKRVVKFFDVRKDKDIDSKYFVVSINKKSIFKVDKAHFSSLDKDMFIQMKRMFFRCLDGTREENKVIISNFLLYNPEINFHSFSDVTEGIRMAISGLAIIGSSKKKVDNAKNIITSRPVILAVAGLLIKFLHIYEHGLDVYGVIETCIELYRLYVATDSVSDYKPNSGLSLTALVAFGSMFLPKALYEIIKRMSAMSNGKILDDMSGFFGLYTLVLSFIDTLFCYLPFEVPEYFKNFFNNLLQLSSHRNLFDIKTIYKQWKSEPHIMIESSFRSNVKDLYKRVKDDISLVEWSRRSKGVQQQLNELDCLMKATSAYESSARQEPACFIFEGPPATMKSVLMGKVIKSLKKSTYVHVTKGITDGKDFYDAYNNEEIFYMDDVGQQGVSQWRNIINMVAPVKLPLDCAAAELKDTKFFTSEIIMLTTNCFTNLTGISKNDGISNVSALWRRGYVFDFSKVVRNNNILTGVIIFKYFNTLEGRWLTSFPEDFIKAWSRKFKISTVCDASLDHLQIVAWMKLIISLFQKLKDSQYQSNEITDRDVDKVDEYMSTFLIDDTFEEEEEFLDATATLRARLFNVNNFTPEVRPEEVYYTDEHWYDQSLGEIIYDGVTYPINFISYYFNFIKDIVLDFVSQAMETIVSMWNDEPDFRYLVCVIAVFLGCFVYGACVGIFAGEKGAAAATICGPIGVMGHSFFATAERVIEENRVNADNVHPSVNSLQKQMFEISVNSINGKFKCIGLVSGRNIITVSHCSMEEEAYITVYKDCERKHILIDNAKVRLKYRDVKGDLIIWSLPDNYPSPFKNLSKCFSVCDKYNNSFLIHPKGIVNLDPLRTTGVEIPTPYTMVYKDKRQVTNEIYPDDVNYYLHYVGLCGSLVVTDAGKVAAIHVAGSSQGKGVALRLSNKTIEKIREVLSENYMKVNVDMSDKVIDNFSGIKLTSDCKVFTPKSSSLVESPLYNVFPVNRFPANLSKYGNHTVKDVSKKSFKPTCDVNEEEIIFANTVIDAMIDDFEPLPMREVILGNDSLAGMNKKSSNGFNCVQGKDKCFDYEKGELTKEFEEDYNIFLKKVHEKEYNLEDVAWFETLKDELRPKEKDPRSFRVSRVHLQVLTKRIFGNMVSQIVRDRKTNQIMVGVNPYEEWEDLYNLLKSYLKWAGDIQLWDGSMLPQAQNGVYEVLRRKFKGSKEELDFVMGFITYCLVLVNDDSYMTTHSMPSGSFLTAILNSLINRYYTAMWYYRNMSKKMKPSVALFNHHIIDLVYGDDKVNALRNSDYKDVLNAITMKEFFVSIGMNFTDSNKKEIVEPFQSIEEITFLKRAFVYNKELGKIVGPLSLETLYSSLSFVDGKKDVDVVVADKISAFQREIFLHPGLFDDHVDVVEKKCLEMNIPFQRLSKSYLKNLYLLKEYRFKENFYGVF